MKNTNSAKTVDFEDRVSEAFGFASRAEIAEKLDVHYQTLSNWLKERTDFPKDELAKIAKLTDFSLNWILTGEGEKRIAKPKVPTLLNEDNLASFVRGIVREELRKEKGRPSLGQEFEKEEDLRKKEAA